MAEAGPHEHRLWVVNGRVDDAAVFQRVVPVSLHKDETAAGVDPSRRIPNPAGPVADPCAGPPGPCPVAAHIKTRGPGHVGAGCRDGGADVERGGWLLHLRFLVDLLIGLPVAGIPPPAVALAVETAWEPFLARWRLPPETADPEVVGPFVVVVPVAVDPQDIVALGLVLGRFLADGLGWFGHEQRTADALGVHRLGEGLMDGALVGRLALLKGETGQKNAREPDHGKTSRGGGFNPLTLGGPGVAPPVPRYARNPDGVFSLSRQKGAAPWRDPLKNRFGRLDQPLASFLRAAALSVLSQVKLASSRPKWPWRAVSR